MTYTVPNFLLNGVKKESGITIDFLGRRGVGVEQNLNLQTKLVGPSLSVSVPIHLRDQLDNMNLSVPESWVAHVSGMDTALLVGGTGFEPVTSSV